MENDRANMKYPLQHLPAATYWAYALQVNLYGYILEQEYDMKVAGYYLAQVHPDGEAPRLISCPRMEAEMRAIHAYEVQCGRAGLSTPGSLAPFLLP
jgi:hypothetical protein